MNREEEIDKMIEEEISNAQESEHEKNESDNKKDLTEQESQKEEDKKQPIYKKLGKKILSKLKNKYNLIRYAVMAVALVVFAYAAYELTLIYVESREAEDTKSEASDMFLVDIDDLTGEYEPQTNADGETIDLENQGDGKLFVFDYEMMLDYNSDAKGYIRQDDGEYIDNPILQYTDNEYYLTHLANHKKSSVGSIFIDCNIKEGLEAKNCIIYGHNMGERVGRIMFGSLNWYYSKTGYYKEHPTFDIWVENKHYRYYVFAIYKTDAVGSPVYTYSFDSDEAFMEYINMCKSNSKYTFEQAPEITKDSKIITLSTCTHSDEYRMIVQLVRGEELDIYGNVIESAE